MISSVYFCWLPERLPAPDPQAKRDPSRINMPVIYQHFKFKDRMAFHDIQLEPF